MSYFNKILICITILLGCNQKQLSNKHIDFSQNDKYLGVVKWKNTICPPEYKRIEGVYSLDSNLYLDIVVKNDLVQNLSTEMLFFKALSVPKAGSSRLSIKLELIKNTYKVEDWILEDYQKKEFYQIEFKKSEINVKAFELKGLSNGLATLYFELKYGSRIVPKIIKDWPDIKSRYLQIELKGMDPEVVIHILERAWIGHFNGLLLCMHNSVKFLSINDYVEKWAMSKNDFKHIVDYARGLKFEVVPQFSLLSHQKKELIDIDVSPELMHNKLTLNPANDEVYEIIFSLIDEVDSLIQPFAIHIGHDEVLGYLEKHRKLYGQQLPANLFLKNVLMINDYLSQKNIQTWMWGDMLLNPETFPDMHSSSLNATAAYEKLIDSIPNDIVICDWHYLHAKWRYLKPLSFPSIKYFQRNGHRVIGATFKEKKVIEQLTRAIYMQQPKNETAMIATVWHEMLNGSIE